MYFVCHADLVLGGVFKLELFLPDDYPMCPPRIRFLTRIYHPNIDRLGRICLDVLKNNWSPALQIRTILLSIQALLGAPNPEDPLNEAVAKQWKVRDPVKQEGMAHIDTCFRRISPRPSRRLVNGPSNTRSLTSEELESRSGRFTNIEVAACLHILANSASFDELLDRSCMRSTT